MYRITCSFCRVFPYILNPICFKSQESSPGESQLDPCNYLQLSTSGYLQLIIYVHMVLYLLLLMSELLELL